ncbi:MAG: hypothetical protein ACTSR8_14005 [Promethearchaeota archaeon]
MNEFSPDREIIKAMLERVIFSKTEIEDLRIHIAQLTSGNISAKDFKLYIWNFRMAMLKNLVEVVDLYSQRCVKLNFNSEGIGVKQLKEEQREKDEFLMNLARKLLEINSTLETL